jgi:hypothetical protein
MGVSVGPAVFVERFTHTGIQIDGGHETLIHESWFVGTYMLARSSLPMSMCSLCTFLVIQFTRSFREEKGSDEFLPLKSDWRAFELQLIVTVSARRGQRHTGIIWGHLHLHLQGPALL